MYESMSSTQVPLFKQGELAHSSMPISQCSPIQPAGKRKNKTKQTPNTARTSTSVVEAGSIQSSKQ
jgi:hypothetical protein